jgi:nucleoside-diphosphate-sugar epimerase
VGLFMKMWAQAGQGMVIDGGAMWTTTVHVDDAVRLYLLAAEKGGAGESCKCACVCVGIKANIGVRQCNG